MKEKIVTAFNTQSNNTVPVLAKQFNVSEYTVHNVLDKYLKSKKQ